jgi:SAM-dependent methyltransferase
MKLDLCDHPAWPEEVGYVAFHAPRFAFLLELLARQDVGPATRILDVGPSRLTELIALRFATPVHSLGYNTPHAIRSAHHLEFDLRDCMNKDRWLQPATGYDLIVFAEVIEHLAVPPEAVLGCLAALLRPGGRIVVQTPNAAALTKRVKLLLGRNPYDVPNGRSDFSSHVREYTLGELRTATRQAGLALEMHWRRYYFDARFGQHGRSEQVQNVLGTLKNLAYRGFPPPLREGMTLLLRRSEDRQ